MNNICVRAGAYYFPPGNELAAKLSESYSLPNPDYRMAQGLRNRGRWVEMPPARVSACQEIPHEHPWGGGMAIPRNANIDGSGLKIIDKRTYPVIKDPLTPVGGYNLRAYQEDALSQWIKADQEGVIVAPCGAGKTTIGIFAITACETKTLILVHTNDLAEQWTNRIDTTLEGCTTSVYGGGKRDDSGRVVVATFQTLDRMSWVERYEWAKQFGLCIVDECHHVPAEMFSRVIMTIPAKHRLGLTATPHRQDGLTSMLWWHLGPAVYEITNEDLAKDGHVLPPRVEWLMTDWKGPKEQMDWPKLVNEMAANMYRNERIISRIVRAIEDGRQVLVLSDRVNHCSLMAQELRFRGYTAEPLVGRMTKKQRAETLNKARDREIQVVCATTLADEGLDLPSLDTVVLTTPTKALSRIQQRIGRVMRPHPDKKPPLVIDVVDDMGSMRGLAKKRMKLYTRIGCTW